MRFYALSVATVLALALVVPAPAVAAGPPAGPAFSVSAPAAPQPAAAQTLPRHRYEAIRKTTLRSSPGKGTVVAAVARGKELTSTGRTSGKYVQLSRAGKTGWAASADIRRAIMAKYQTSSATPLYASAGSTRQLAKIPADYTLGTRTNARSNGRVKVEYAGKSGWVRSSRVAKVALGVPLGKLGWKASAAKNIAKWCKGVPLSVGANKPNMAEASGWVGHMNEKITLDTTGFGGKKIDPNHPMAVAVQYHECAHIMQYRVYKYDFAKLDRRMDAVYGKPRVADGAEHMADCMAVAMGAKLSGSEYDRGSGNTITWFAGYGGKCNSQHMSAARKVIAGKQV
ncbi:hypothetical protein [Paeniglutamicibacter sp. NPDC091659]|uniref:hypothetical protein n=1 Tax=Paeniglutamicibacter sp. NPDC091659 TaxID=3364389 RepID=UPI0038042774